METKVIIVQSQSDRNRAADLCISDHDTLQPIATPTAFLPCCNRAPDYRSGRGLASAHCPTCGLRSGVWGTNIQFCRHHWNQKVREKSKVNFVDENGFKLIRYVHINLGNYCGESA